ncbi:AraC family transcriptional regulator [Paenibacillus qinlingensis]|uniref:AraC-like DNA-binding protein n=1 Tax=Paenibacillus qinlingensis TaxID=1837343 RepID=A0ABU1NS56_9BACL|nr:AraC family transcriptional regulator [Paenibacillus qinlingensis]MDR6550316.1 AraC-like DNA-binding protein [Paenibacillus qinlingensis]
MQTISMSRLTKLDVKWAGEAVGNTHLQQKKSNPFYELIIVTQGTVYLQVRDEPFTLVSGECLLLMPWEEHSSWKPISDQDGFYWVQFGAEPGLQLSSAPLHTAIVPTHQDLRTSPLGSEVSEQLLLPRRIQPRNRFEWLYVFDQLLHQMNTSDGYYRYRSSLLLGQLLVSIAEAWLLEREDSIQPLSTFQLYRRLVNLMDEEYTSDLNGSALEAKVHHAYEYLCQVFKKHSGMTIVSYLHDLRIQRAKYLLTSDNLSIGDIAQQVGFQDPYYFSRVFKNKVGVSPQKFRDASTNGNGS